ASHDHSGSAAASQSSCRSTERVSQLTPPNTSPTGNSTLHSGGYTPWWSSGLSMLPCRAVTMPLLPRTYAGVRGLPAGFARFTCTRSPTWKRCVASGAPMLASARVASDARRGQRLRGAHERVDGDEARQLFLAPAVGARGSARQHHPAHVAGAVMHAHLDILG